MCCLGDELRKHLVFPMSAEHLKSFLPICIVKSNITHTPRKEKNKRHSWIFAKVHQEPSQFFLFGKTSDLSEEPGR